VFELVRTLAYLAAAKVTLNPHTQNRRMRHPLREPVGNPPCKGHGIEDSGQQPEWRGLSSRRL